MMTAIGMLQAAGFFVVALVARAALLVALIMVLSVPLMAYAYGARALQVAWQRHHGLRHAHHHT